jgi:polysaccharide export outer membrane protein
VPGDEEDDMTRVWMLAVTAALGLAAGMAQAQEAAPRSDYIIGPGDTLKVFVWSHEDLSVVVPVRPDGRISTPLVEDMQASGKTSTQLARDIEGVLQQYVRTPTVSVIVEQFVGAFSESVRVVGQATKPQALPYRDGMTLLDAMIAVGGLAEYAAGNRAKVIRKVNGKQTEIKVRLDDLLNDGDVRQNMPLQPGDIVIIPESRF